MKACPGIAFSMNLHGTKLVKWKMPVKFYSFQIIIEKEPEDAGYYAYTPTLPGCFSNGKTIEETKHNIRQAIEEHLESMLAHAQPAPLNPA